MTPKELITDEMIEEEAESRYPVTRHISPESSPYVGAKKTFVHGAKWARDLLSTHTREVAEKAFEAGMKYMADYAYGRKMCDSPPYTSLPDKETYLNSLNPEGK